MAQSELDILKRALELRAPVLFDADAWRWLDADTDPYGVTIERYGKHAVLNAYSEAGAVARDRWGHALMQLGVEGVYYKHRLRDDLRKVSRDQIAPTLPLVGAEAPEQFPVREHTWRFAVRLADGLSTGLFLDQRDNRQRIAALSPGKRVVNLFCYTGSFSVAAGSGGALQVTSVDLSGAVLRRVDENLQLNRLAKEQHRLLRSDCVEWVGRAVRRRDTYDLVIVDPPSFGSDGGKTWSVGRDYFALIEDTLRLVDAGGTLLCVTNHRGTSLEAFEAGVRAAAGAAGRRILAMELPPPPVDCPAGARSPASQGATKSAMVRVQ